MLRIITQKSHILESYGKPCEGIFWFINNKLISYMDSVDYNTKLDHKTVWKNIRNQYDDVAFDYYPHGRVIVNEVRNSDETLIKYKAYIYIDDCINTEEIIDNIKYQFSLDKCEIMYVGSDGGVTSNHYKCNNCK